MVLDLLIRIRVCFADIKSWEERSSPWDLNAHKAEHIGYEFEIAGELLKSCGFRYYTEFENRKAVFRRIP
mgnify:CR=1 FL=1